MMINKDKIKSEVSRRKFLSATAAISAGLAAVNVATTASAKRSSGLVTRTDCSFATRNPRNGRATVLA